MPGQFARYQGSASQGALLSLSVYFRWSPKMGESYVYITGTSDRQEDRMEDLQAILPDGSEFDFWEQKTQWKREWIVDAKASEDGADGTTAHPFRRIQQAASLAEPGDSVRIHAGVYR